MQIVSVSFRVVLMVVFLNACGGGGGDGGGSLSPVATGNEVNTQNIIPPDEQMLSFKDDINAILQGRCAGCHNGGDKPVAPISLAGVESASTFKSAIYYSIEGGTMPPTGSAQLSKRERDMLLAWSGDKPYIPSNEVLLIPLVNAQAWDTQSENRDVFLDRRPAVVDCELGTGWLVEDDVLEVRSGACNYASLSQDSLLDLEAGTTIELNLSHSALTANEPAIAFLALSIGVTSVWETEISIPSESGVIKASIVLPVAVQRGDAIAFTQTNHGRNTYTFHSLNALINSDQQLEYCPTYDSTWDAIYSEALVTCANSACHSEEVKAGGLDLTRANAYANLVDVQSQGSLGLRLTPKKPSQSSLFRKLSAATHQGSYADLQMPPGGTPLTPSQLEAIQIWISQGAPEVGSVGDTLGLQEDYIEDLLGVCLPEPGKTVIKPLNAPLPGKGVQSSMPWHSAPAEAEREICFAVYEDFRDQIPAEFMDETGDNFYIKGGKNRQAAYTHHNLVYQSPVGIDQIHAPEFGEWTCGAISSHPDAALVQGRTCEPTDLDSCGQYSKCRAELRNSIACRGYGPRAKGGSTVNSGATLGLGTGIEKDGYFKPYPVSGIFYWNSHVFNLSTEDGTHAVWRNFDFATDRRFEAKSINDTSRIFIATGVAPFTKERKCADYVFDQGDGLLAGTSHNHKRGESWSTTIKATGEIIYESYTYDDPAYIVYEPPLTFNSADPAKRTVENCAIYNNGVNADGSPNIELVTRLSQRPPNARSCRPTACVAGKVAASCNGKDDNASCDSEPGLGDGWCDACAISGAFSSDDEMFIYIGSKLPNYDAQMSKPVPVRAAVTIIRPTTGETFTPGDTVSLEFSFDNFGLAPPEDAHGHDDSAMPSDGASEEHHDSDSSLHPDAAGAIHNDVSVGHYHLYLDTNDDAAEHVTAFSDSLEFDLPADIAPGTHTFRISLRARDHHMIGVESSVTIQVN